MTNKNAHFLPLGRRKGHGCFHRKLGITGRGRHAQNPTAVKCGFPILNGYELNHYISIGVRFLGSKVQCALLTPGRYEPLLIAEIAALLLVVK